MKTLNVSYKEEQRINQWWMHLILLGTLGVLIWAVYVSWGSEELRESVVALIIFWGSMLLGLATILMAWMWKLSTSITNYGIEMKCPMVRKKVAWDNIAELEVLDYGFVGGWGIRIGTKFGTVYNTSGSKGLRIKLKNNKKFLIGTQKEDELKRIVEKWKNI